jgi:anti-anti-sigma regulatory factor
MKCVGVEFHPARVKPEVKEILEKVGVDRTIGSDHIHSKLAKDVQWFTRKNSTNYR